MRRFKQALDHIHETGLLQPSDLQFPIRASPPTAMQPIPGYEGGALDPQKLGVACMVVPPSQGRGVYSTGEWGLKAVPTPSLHP